MVRPRRGGEPAARPAALGLLYANGRGVPKDAQEAENWYRRAAAGYRRAADVGDVGAQFRLGQLYENGMGVPKDLQAAVGWYRKAADQGREEARRKIEALE